MGLAMVLGFASSSCSFAALAATRSLFTKGAALTSALAFMFASTNLAVEVAALAFIFLGWQYVVALFVGAPILVAVMALLVHLTKPRQLTDAARKHAEDVAGMETNPGEGLPESLSERARDGRAWHRVGTAYVAEWGMVYKELVVGFLVAGAVAGLVPAAFFQMLFPGGQGAWWTVPVQAALAPVLAVLTFIGSMGNGPLAAILASHGVVFGAIMTFLYADFVVPPALKINADYYGWRFAGYLAAVFAVSAVIAGVVVHLLFAVAGLLPRGGGESVAEMATFAIDYTFWLNLLAIAVAVALVVLSRRKPTPEQENETPQTAGAATQ
ncbi:MAG: permease [Actinomycetota bacterium]|nr:permease [Actinomycetota bacterium]